LNKNQKKLDTVEEKLEFIEQNILSVFYFVPLQTLFYVVNSLTYLKKAKTIISKYLDDTTQLHNVEKSLPNNVTTEMGMELLLIARKIDQSGEHPSPEHPEIKKFLKRYGHRTYLEIDPGVPRWKENPEYIINLIQSYITNKSYEERIKKYYMGKKEAEETIKDIAMKLKEKGAFRDARKVEKILTNYRKLFGTRELPKYIMIKGVSLFREILLEIGEELVAQHRLDNKQDIFFVNFKDIRFSKKLHHLVLQQQKAYQQELKRISVPRVVTSTGETIFSPNECENNNEFQGIPVSPGIKEGEVKILNHPEESDKLNKGDILVTKATNPSWTPLFLEIGGLITEMGGPISHGSVIAREYGIPAIAGVNQATSRFKDRQLIRLNGETGKVEIL
jgi:rifampicin phosphotransferase